jgi:hypothetical protein
MVMQGFVDCRPEERVEGECTFEEANGGFRVWFRVPILDFWR